MKIDESPVSVNGEEKFWFGPDSELSCNIDNGNPVCVMNAAGMSFTRSHIRFKNFLDTCAILYGLPDLSGAMKVVPIVEAVVNKCIHWNFNDMTQSVFVTPVEGFKICFKNTLRLTPA